MKFVYYSLRIPYTERHRTPWHPTDSEGPFSVLSSGVFDTHEDAMMWARTHLGPTEWSIVRRDDYLRAHLAHFRTSVRHGRRSTGFAWRWINRRRAVEWYAHLRRGYGAARVYSLECGGV